MSKGKELDLHSLSHELAELGHKFRRYAGVTVFVLFAIVYAFIVLRINMLSSAPADQSKSSSSTTTLRVDENAAKQLQSLKDNSTNVQALFEQDRTNPFQE